jgi:hypothetical protein
LPAHLENISNPHRWETACRYDPDTGILDDIDTPQERVQFLQDIAQTMFVKARIKLNIKRLYAADGKAVREILKVADLLYRASLQAHADPEVFAEQLSCLCRSLPQDVSLVMLPMESSAQASCIARPK